MGAISRFGPPLALMGLIFFLSAQRQLATDLGAADLVLRKLAHMAEYGLLWLLWRRALDGRGLAAAVIAVAYAVTDELHQAQVPGRNGTPVDVAIDTAGIAITALLAPRMFRRNRG